MSRDNCHGNYQAVVKWHEEDACFYLWDIELEDALDNDELYALKSEYEIIGNIYENSGLLQ